MNSEYITVLSNDKQHSVPRIEVAGSIGSGKTTLVGNLSTPFINEVYEDHTINPFWKTFYTDPSTCAFETEVSFLLQHYHFAKCAAAKTKCVILLDHSFELDMAYAEVGLVGSRKDIFRLDLPRDTERDRATPCAGVHYLQRRGDAQTHSGSGKAVRGQHHAGVSG